MSSFATEWKVNDDKKNTTVSKGAEDDFLYASHWVLRCASLKPRSTPKLPMIPSFSKKSPLVASGGRILLDAHLARA